MGTGTPGSYIANHALFRSNVFLPVCNTHGALVIFYNSPGELRTNYTVLVGNDTSFSHYCKCLGDFIQTIRNWLVNIDRPIHVYGHNYLRETNVTVIGLKYIDRH